MLFWGIALASYIVTVAAVRCFVANETRKKYRNTLMFLEPAIAAALTFALTVWRRWDVVDFRTGTVMPSEDVVPPLVICFVMASVVAIAFFWAERRKER